MFITHCNFTLKTFYFTIYNQWKPPNQNPSVTGEHQQQTEASDERRLCLGISVPQVERNAVYWC